MSAKPPYPRHPPSQWVRRFAPLIPKPGGGKSWVLDLACGGGRHTRFLLDLGYKVVAVDRDVSDLSDLKPGPDLEIIETDLEDGGPWPLGSRRFHGIVVTNYLHRPLFPALLAAIEGSGVLIYETFARGNERHHRPRNPDFLLNRGELLELISAPFHIVAFEQGMVECPRTAVVQRICAVKEVAGGDDPPPHPLAPGP
jgi:SAM-dependent methyltransferase